MILNYAKTESMLNRIYENTNRYVQYRYFKVTTRKTGPYYFFKPFPNQIGLFMVLKGKNT